MIIGFVALCCHKQHHELLKVMHNYWLEVMFRNHWKKKNIKNHLNNGNDKTNI